MLDVDFEMYMELRRWTEIFVDLQGNRIALSNKLGMKADGTPTKERPNSIRLDETKFESLIAHAVAQESEAQKIMLGCYRDVAPKAIQQWQKDTNGIGEHSVAKLLGYIGHPRIAFPFFWDEDADGKRAAEPTPLPPFQRKVSDLWQYAGVGAPLRRKKGMTKEESLALGNPNAKKATWMMVQGIIKAGSSEYRDYYDLIKDKEQWRITDLEWSKGHLNNHAIRLVMKRILKDLWILSAED
jgi:hypothetical protein